jgi:putative ABC transport system permease protein
VRLPAPRGTSTFTAPPSRDTTIRRLSHSRPVPQAFLRRTLLAALALLGACGAEESTSRPIIGLMTVASSAPLDDARQGFLRALADSGFIPGKTFTLLDRNAQGDIPALTLIANEFVQQNVTEVATISSIATQSAIKVITDRPVVFGAVSNPYIIGAGTTATSHRPNVTGAESPIPVDSTLGLGLQVFPKIRTWGTLFDPSDPFAEFYLEMAREGAKRLGVTFISVACTSPTDIVTGVHALAGQGVQGIMQIPSVMIGGGMPALVKAARELGVPVISATPAFDGPPLGLGISFYDNGYAMGLVMLRVLHGEDPATIPFVKKVTPQVSVDLASAQAFNITIPANVIARANMVNPVAGTAADSGIRASRPSAPRNSPWALWLSTLAQGLAFVALAWGVYLSSRVLRFPDITPEGSLTLGGSVTATLIVAGVHPLLASLAAFLAGMLAGYVTGLLHTRLRIVDLLTGILVMTALYSVNLRIMGRSNVSLLDRETLASRLQAVIPATASWGSDVTYSVIFAVIVLLLGLALAWYLRTDFGMAMRAVGDNSAMIRAQGVDPRRMVELGLALANGCVAFSGALIAQYQGFADVGMGVGALVTGMAAVILGETLKPARWGLAATIAMVAFGAMLFRALVAVALRAGLNPIDLKLATAVFVLVALALPRLRGGMRMKGATR